MPLELPDDPNLLAEIVASDPDLSRRDAAFSRLLATIVPIADRVADRYRNNHPTLADSVAAKAPLLIRFKLLTSGTFEARLGTFNGWCQTILKNTTNTLIRRAYDVEVRGRGGYFPDGAEPDPTATESWQTWRHRHQAATTPGDDPRRVQLRTITRLLLEVAWDPKRDVDLYAVLLLWVRVELTHRACLATDRQCDSDVGPDNLVAGIAQGLPWTCEQQTRQIRKQLPELAGVWQGVCQHAASPQVWNGEGFHAVLAAFLNRERQGGPEITRPQSEKWKERARDVGRRKIRQCEPGAWEACFAEWMEARDEPV